MTLHNKIYDKPEISAKIDKYKLEQIDNGNYVKINIKESRKTNLFFKYMYFFKNFYKIKFHLYDHRGAHKPSFGIMNRFLFYITLIRYKYIIFLVTGGVLLIFYFGTAGFY